MEWVAAIFPLKLIGVLLPSWNNGYIQHGIIVKQPYSLSLQLVHQYIKPPQDYTHST